MPGSLPVLDTLGRPMRDLRISVTDRCNFRCTYCMPKEAFGSDHAFLPRAEILDYDEIERVVRGAVRLGGRRGRGGRSGDGGAGSGWGRCAPPWRAATT